MTKKPKLPPPTTDGLPPRRLLPGQDCCFVAGCSARHYARGLCRHHYRAAYYAANSERAKAQARQWYAEHGRTPGDQTGTGHPGGITDVRASDDGHGVARSRPAVPDGPSARRATPRRTETPPTGQEDQ